MNPNFQRRDAWSREVGFSLGQKAVEEKSNEITALPELLKKLQIKGQIITIDAMGTQTAIAEEIRGKRADYVLALKGNQRTLHEEVKEYFADAELCEKIEKAGGYKKTTEKAHSQTETREYYQTEDVGWLEQKKEWKGLKSIAMERKSIEKNGKKTVECRYFISSLKEDIETGTDKKEIIYEEKAVCNQSVTNRVFGGGIGILKIEIDKDMVDRTREN